MNFKVGDLVTRISHNHDILFKIVSIDSDVAILKGVDLRLYADSFVNDLEKAKEFFVKYFNATSNEGYHNKTTDFRSYFLSFDDGARLEIMNKPQMSDEEKGLNRTGYIHIAFSLGSKEAVDMLTEKIRNDGYNVISGPRTTGDGYYESCIIGIEGNQIEITV